MSDLYSNLTNTFYVLYKIITKSDSGIVPHAVHSLVYLSVDLHLVGILI